LARPIAARDLDLDGTVRLLAKLGMGNRVQAAILAHDAGLLG